MVVATARGRSSRKNGSVPATVVQSSRMKDFLNAQRVETRLVGPIERMLLAEGDEDGDRRQDALHVSELSKADFCPLAAYQRILGLANPADAPRMRLQAIFEEGHDVHAKWQRWIRRLGRLYGKWLCAVCDTSWMATSPEQCPNCSAPGWKIHYREVPVDAFESHMLLGHGDGQLDDAAGAWIEAKTIGIGTVRMEAPKLLMKYTRKGVTLRDIDGLLEWVTDQYRQEHLSQGRLRAEVDDIPKSLLTTWVDFEGLWKDVRRPFPTHLRQGNLYGGAMGIEEVIFIYEYKPTQAYKEFVVKTSPGIYEPMLEMALDVKWAVEQRKPPRCPHDTCKACSTSEQKRDNGTGATGNSNTPRSAARKAAPRRDDGAGSGDATGQGRSGEAGALPGTPAVRRITRTPRGRDGAERQRPDEGVRELHGLGRLLGGATSSS